MASADIILVEVAWAVLGVAIPVIAALRGGRSGPDCYSISHSGRGGWCIFAFAKHRILDIGPLDEEEE